MSLRVGVLFALSATAALAVLALGFSASDALAVRTCSPPSHIGNDNPQMAEIYADGTTSCSMATMAIAHGHLNKGGNLVTPGWKCRASHKLDQTGVVLGANISCTKGAGAKYAFAFAWST